MSVARAVAVPPSAVSRMPPSEGSVERVERARDGGLQGVEQGVAVGGDLHLIPLPVF